MPFEGSHCPSCRGALGSEKQALKAEIDEKQEPSEII